DPRSVRRTARRLGLHTDASHRFERGVDPAAVPRVLARAASLIAKLGGGKVVPTAIDRVAREIAPQSIRFRPARARALLGTEIPADITRRIFEGIGAKIVSDSDAGLIVEAPTHRPDLGREADLIEELARIYGYDNIPTTVPRVRPSSEGTPFELRFLTRIRHAACAAGMHEAVCYGFVAPGDLEAARVSTNAVALANPLSEERSVMRTSLLPGLAQAVAHARRHGAREASLFEIGRTFHPSDEALPIERRRFALLLSAESAFDFYDGKGRILAILSSLGAASADVALDATLDSTAPYLHPRRRATVRVGETPLGHVGELHPDVAEALDLGTRAVYAELDIESLVSVIRARGDAKAPELPRFPATTRDIAMFVDDALPMAEARAVLLEASKPLGESVELFDVYRGEHVPEGQKSFAFRVVYRDPAGTLTDKKVDKAHQRVCDAARQQLAATLR
ncbi:MAG: phenylalanine--tRNA ligase subunit beta, partial [Polyangiaceae bacterium]|nr:phenylalanine--tRNA ligase subunit beta [Polyangiaceae bacterium]